MKAWGYSRVSTGRQAAEGISLTDQRARIEAWANAHGADLMGFHTDAGLSGTRADNRAGLQAALDAVCREQGVLVVYDLSRLARSLPDAVRILERLMRAKATLVCLVEGIDTGTATGELLYGILSSVNAFVARAGRERTRAIRQHKAANGEYLGGEAPYGWRTNGGDKPLPVEDEQTVLAMIRRLHSEGTRPGTIARKLNHAGVPCRGAAWHAKTVQRILGRGL